MLNKLKQLFGKSGLPDTLSAEDEKAILEKGNQARAARSA